MKNLTTLSVYTVLDLLIHTNGSTTTLDVKNTLRDLGYFAEQNKVKEIIDALFENNDNYIRDNSNTNYYVYSWTTAHELVIGGYTTDYVEDTTDTNDVTNSTQTSALSNSNNQFNAIVNGSPIVTREPEHIYYVETHAKNHTDKFGDTWVVYHTDGNNEIHMYNETLTRDQVRSKYASLLNVKIQDVRSKRLTNFKK